jgi:hypothetical protein
MEQEGSYPTNLQPSIIVFDFDYTLSSAHMYHLIGGGHIINWHQPLKREEILDNRDYIAKIIFGGEDRLKMIDEFLKKETSKACQIAISSNNYLMHIKRALEKVDLLKYFTWIHGRDSLYRSCALNLKTNAFFNEVGKKHDFILAFLEPKYGCIVFIDDEMLDVYHLTLSWKKNIRLLNMRKGQKGIDQNDLDRIEDALKECETKKLVSTQQQIALCIQCKEREGHFYSPLNDVLFCDPYCERIHNLSK